MIYLLNMVYWLTKNATSLYQIMLFLVIPLLSTFEYHFLAMGYIGAFNWLWMGLVIRSICLKND